MELESLIRLAADSGASDLHLEPGLSPAMRIRGTLCVAGEAIPAKDLAEMAQLLTGEEQWQCFLQRQSFDLSKTIQGVRCRINILRTSRGVGMAIRLLVTFQATVEKLNLHPDLKKFIKHAHGLILVSGPTGCGKSSTLAALIQEINLTETRHIITVESPIEYAFRPRRAYIRQREVGRDTPSFEQALLDALREDPDVLMVGEMRDPETAAVAVTAALAGQTVLATVHSNDATRTIDRLVEFGVARHSLAAALTAVVAQRLVRRLCPNCKRRQAIPPELRPLLVDCEGTWFVATGCSACEGHGYSGRTAVFEILSIDDPLRESIAAGASSSVLAQLAKDRGHRSLFDDAAAKLAAGVTSFSEVERVVGWWVR